MAVSDHPRTDSFPKNYVSMGVVSCSRYGLDLYTQPEHDFF